MVIIDNQKEKENKTRSYFIYNPVMGPLNSIVPYNQSLKSSDVAVAKLTAAYKKRLTPILLQGSNSGYLEQQQINTRICIYDRGHVTPSGGHAYYSPIGYRHGAGDECRRNGWETERMSTLTGPAALLPYRSHGGSIPPTPRCQRTYSNKQAAAPLYTSIKDGS